MHSDNFLSFLALRLSSVKLHNFEKHFERGGRGGLAEGMESTFESSAKLQRSRRSGLFFLVGALLVGGCDGTTNEVTTVARDSAGIRIVEVLAEPSTVPEWTLDSVPLRMLTGMETGDETAFAFVGPVRFLPSGGVVIADVASSRLLIYDAEGRYVRSLGRRGDGPGELRRLESITVDQNGTIATFDPSLRRLSFWNPDTGFVRSISVADGGSLESWPADAAPRLDSQLVVFQLAATPQDSVPPGSGIRRRQMRAHLTLRDSVAGILKVSPRFAGMYSGLDDRGELRLPFSNRPFVALAKDRVYFGSGESFQVTYLDTAFNTAGEIRWPARDERLTSEEVERVRAEAIALVSRRPLPDKPFARYFAPEILPTNRPSIGRVFVDREGRLWIERFEAIRMGTATQKPGDQWSILSEDGVPLAILRLPSSTRLEDVRDEDVVVVRRDSLDVQTVVVYRLKR